MAYGRKKYKYNSTHGGPATASIIWESAAQAYKVTFTYNAEVVSFLKGTIPASDRTWEPDIKAWFITERYFLLIKIFLEGKGFRLTTFSKEEATEFQKQQEEQHNYGAIHRQSVDVNTEFRKFSDLIQKARIPVLDMDSLKKDEILAKQLYRKAALAFHPDRNPEGASLMSELNTTWDKLRQFYYEPAEQTS